MRKIMTILMVMVFVLFSTISVKADGWDTIYTTIEKKSDSPSELYNTMPTGIKKGDNITVKLVAHNVGGWQLIDGTNQITWDEKAFSLVETNGKHYRVVSNHIDTVRMEVIGSNKATINYRWKDEDISENIVDFIELDFIVNKDIVDGIYKINLSNSDAAMRILVSGDHYSTPAKARTLKYQLGNKQITSNYTKSDIENIPKDVYVIGNYLFTRTPNEQTGYDGSLTTELIMLAAKSIDSDDKNDMKIYLKSAYGEWKNAISNSAIDSLDSYPIKYIDMKVNYLENGVYSTGDYNKILRLVQINKDEAIITIESASERIHGIASINGKNASLKIGNKTYAITIGENSISIDGSETLQKRANMSVNDYFNDTYAMAYYSGYDAASHYLQSVHTGKYTKGNYELYLLRVGENTAKICLKEKGQSSCIIDQYIQGNEGFSHNVGASPTTYALRINNVAYGFNWSDNSITIDCLEGSCNSSYGGTYSKLQGLTMDDVFHIWETNTIKYAVTINENNNNPLNTVFVSAGSKINDICGKPEKSGSFFVEWRKNSVDGERFDPEVDTITSSVTLYAIYRDIPGTPVLEIVSNSNTHDYYDYDYENGQFTYHLSITLDGDYDGYDILKEGAVWSEISRDNNKGDVAVVTLDANTQNILAARAYVMINGEKKPATTMSSPVSPSTTTYTISFNSNGGTSVNSIVVPYYITPSEIDAHDEIDIAEPTRTHFEFIDWFYNDQPFSAVEQVISDMTLIAHWNANIAKPVLASANGSDFYEKRLYLSNHNAYCENENDVNCTMLSTDNYYVGGYEIYEKINGVIVETPIEVNSATRFAPYEYATLTIEPNSEKHFVIRTYMIDNGNTYYSEYSNELEFDTTIPTPVISFDPTAGTQDPTYEVENWIKISDLNNTYGFYDNDTLAGYKITGFVLYKGTNPEDEVQAGGVSDTIHVTANYGENKHYYVRAWVLSNGEEYRSDFSNELILDTTAPVCYIDGNSQYHWTKEPESNWLEVPGVTTEATCHAPACFVDSSDGYHWTRNPQTGWNEVSGITNENNCHGPVCYKDSNNEYHWTIVPQEDWVVQSGITTQTDCHAPDTSYACYINFDTGEYHWTNNPEDEWIYMGDDINNC